MSGYTSDQKERKLQQMTNTVSKLKVYFSPNNLLAGAILLFILLLPYQTRQIFSQTSNQYTTLSIYGFDIIFALLALSWIWYWYAHKELKPNWALVSTGLTMIILTGLSGYWAGNHDVALFYWLHLMQAVWLIAIVATTKLNHRFLLGALVFDGMVQAVFIITQAMTQTVVANKLFGISAQHSETSGVAVVVTTTGRWLRAYGTMPHPNIVAGLLVICLCATIILWLEIRHYMTRVMLLAIAALLSTSLLLTFSRSAVIVWCLCLLLFLIVKRSSYKIVLVSGITLSIIGMIYWPLLASRTSTTQFVEQLSITERTDQLTEAGNLFKQYWPEGTGIGQYTLLAGENSNPQPVHNAVVLQFVELGVLITAIWYGFIGIIAYFSFFPHKTIRTIHVILIAALSLSLFDHYFWTLPSMLLLFCLILGLQLQAKPKY